MASSIARRFAHSHRTTTCYSQFGRSREHSIDAFSIHLEHRFSQVSNRTELPLIVLDPDAVETQKFRAVATIKPNDEYYLPIEVLYARITPRLYFTIQLYVQEKRLFLFVIVVDILLEMKRMSKVELYPISSHSIGVAKNSVIVF